MSKTTPGPWVYSDQPEKTFWIGVKHPMYGFISHAEVRPGCDEADEMGDMEANARLIAAAPELLDAADMALNTLLACCVSAGGCDDRKTILEAQAMLRSAIAKATKDAT